MFGFFSENLILNLDLLSFGSSSWHFFKVATGNEIRAISISNVLSVSHLYVKVHNASSLYFNLSISGFVLYTT